MKIKDLEPLVFWLFFNKKSSSSNILCAGIFVTLYDKRIVDRPVNSKLENAALTDWHWLAGLLAGREIILPKGENSI